MTRQTTLAQYLKQILPHIPTAASGAWITGYDLAYKANLDYRQVHQAIRFLRDQDPDVPLVAKPGAGFRFTTEGDEVKAYRRKNFKDARTTIGMTHKGAILPYLRLYAPQRVAWVQHQMDMLTESLEIAMQEALV